jgi:hypothetical protein
MRASSPTSGKEVKVTQGDKICSNQLHIGRILGVSVQSPDQSADVVVPSLVLFRAAGADFRRRKEPFPKGGVA